MDDEIQRRVIDAVEAGRLPRGGPSEACAHDLLDDLPDGYFERWANAAAERIRAQRPGCCGGGFADIRGNRCERCWGWAS